ncbi:MAG: multidrug ABC transporter ATP-binding protein [Micavibrio sp. TMED2]|nr:multidrug ABC transporter ATP-binding protein [Alphaproteobacteria bacterium]MAS47762.1 multidrug ABC transporter ATP-binding protein [Alphaproteobacteria bacterium]MAX96925.1 multidrug ABC transporter ATP-binding protein [Alphaproteobacteria bacterium]OUT40192.1 MAG: multidrug ABC transporter ATP-binding protein [Micavibrio sp. TMED2]|tara:strand:- start:14689 stop:15642 length:954 start_codon:yes stop_codon:yes gene_type:complete
MSKSSPDYAVEVKNLVKTYPAAGKAPAKQALKGIDLAVERGSMFALLGPNGAGKSTLINILAGLVRRTSGESKVWGYDTETEARMARAAIGVVPQELNMDAFFTPSEMLDLQGGLYGVPNRERRTKELLELVGLADKADTYARNLSGGMRRRLMVAKAMVHTPPVLVLDEPTAGVDIELRQMLWENVRELNRKGVTVVLTTHYLEEAEELCDTIAIINHGEVVACEPKRKLLGRIDQKEVVITLDRDLDAVPETCRQFEDVTLEGRELIIRYRRSHATVGSILEALGQSGIGIADITTREADLEDIFLELTRRKAAA